MVHCMTTAHFSVAWQRFGMERPRSRPQEEGGVQAGDGLITVSFLSMMTTNVWQIRELVDMRGIVVLVEYTGWRGILELNPTGDGATPSRGSRDKAGVGGQILTSL